MKKFFLILFIGFIGWNNNSQTIPILRVNNSMHTAKINAVSIDASCRYALTASEDKTAKLWDVSTGILLKTFRVPISTTYFGVLSTCALSPDGKVAAVSGLAYKAIAQQNEKRTRTFSVELMAEKNDFTATAFNSDRTESNPNTISVTYSGAQKNTTLHLFVVGINKYKNATYNLNYARADAQAIKYKIMQAGNSIFKDIKVYELYDEKATKQEIKTIIDNIKTTATLSDLFIFFYADHGVMSEPSDNTQPLFYLIPIDVVKMYGNNDMLNKLGISASELRDWCKNIKAQKQVILLDACQSGGAIEAFAMRGAAEEKAILQLGRSAGIVVLSSTGTEQFAAEFSQLKHGIFTYSILEGLNGRADGGKKDGKITIKELESFLNDYIPELSKQYRGEAQYPNSYSTGMDFPLGITK